MNEVIAKCLKEQLRVLIKYLEEDYPLELQDILGHYQWVAFTQQIDNVNDKLDYFLNR